MLIIILEIFITKKKIKIKRPRLKNYRLETLLDFVIIFIRPYKSLFLFYSQVFSTLHSFPTFDTALPWDCRVQDVPLRFETQTRPNCLFKSHSLQQKVKVGGIYLCVKAIQNTISTSFRFWTDSLLDANNVKGISYLLDHKSS